MNLNHARQRNRIGPFGLLVVLLATLTFGSVLSGADEPAPFQFAEFFMAPVRIHLLSSEVNPALHTTLAEADVNRILTKVNGIWSKAGLCFYLESIVHEAAVPISNDRGSSTGNLRRLLAHMPAASHGEEVFNVYYVKNFEVNGVYFPTGIFVKDTAALRPVEGGIDEPLPRVTSHELGHAFGLQHRQDTFNLMASGTTGTALNAAEIEAVRARAAAIPYVKRAPERMSEADALAAEGKHEEARIIFQHVGALPLTGEPIEEIRRKALRVAPSN